MSTPYSDLPASAFWRRSVALPAMGAVDPVTAPWTIGASEKVATAGSCFAQHIGRHLAASGMGYLITEPAHPLITDEEALAFNYGVFTARTGNVYTARQLLQLFHRAFFSFNPAEDCWTEPDGRLIDPFRPTIQPGGFATHVEYAADRRQHLAAVRRAFQSLDVFVFTLGLTEAWESREDGAVFPLCPGAAGGVFDERRHAFHNFSVDETVADLLAFIDALRGVNRAARIILTVSPVPLIATAEPRHVLTSTTYSKSVLRVACEQIAAARPMVAYFPSYEIITGNFSRGAYFANDLRSVTDAGVAHVMRLFLHHYAGREVSVPSTAGPHLNHQAEMARLLQLNCDEEMLDAG